LSFGTERIDSKIQASREKCLENADGWWFYSRLNDEILTAEGVLDREEELCVPEILAAYHPTYTLGTVMGCLKFAPPVIPPPPSYFLGPELT